MKTRIGREGGFERVILVTCRHGFYLAVKPFRTYYRIAIWRYGLLWHFSRS
jgi:hypothetical protein